jgi:hypothetical protein
MVARGQLFSLLYSWKQKQKSVISLKVILILKGTLSARVVKRARICTVSDVPWTIADFYPESTAFSIYGTPPHVSYFINKFCIMYIPLCIIKSINYLAFEFCSLFFFSAEFLVFLYSHTVGAFSAHNTSPLSGFNYGINYVLKIFSRQKRGGSRGVPIDSSRLRTRKGLIFGYLN